MWPQVSGFQVVESPEILTHSILQMTFRTEAAAEDIHALSKLVSLRDLLSAHIDNQCQPNLVADPQGKALEGKERLDKENEIKDELKKAIADAFEACGP